MLTALPRPNRPRRGVTLVEMLVVVALVVLMMVILVQIFQSATGAMSASRTTQELDVVLRQIDSMLRSDLTGVTAQMTPPNDPTRKTGYFEYGENAPADLQGEDTDDYLAFTTKAPEGQVFPGRQWLSHLVNNAQTINQNIQPVTVTSQVAEIIYFLRNGNLYRRVFLVAPDRAPSIKATFNDYTNPPLVAIHTNPNCNFPTSIFGASANVSWLGMNDISCRPGGMTAAGLPLPPIPNDLGDLTNRENRAFHPRLINDINPLDGVPDDNNADGVPDYYATLYYDGVGVTQATNGVGWAPNTLITEGTAVPYLTAGQRDQTNPHDVYAFPFIFPGMYSVPDLTRANLDLGSVHYLYPNATSNYPNHSPLDIGDTPNFTPSGNQTFWGFPTWRETMSGKTSGGGVGWTDPVNFLYRTVPTQAAFLTQPVGLRPIPPGILPATYNLANLLPTIYQPDSYNVPPYFDGYGQPPPIPGSTSFVSAPNIITPNSTQSANPNPIWEDDLILTNVRSFDVKAYDPYAPLYSNATNGLFSVGYQDLGYGALSYVGGLAGSNGGVQSSVLNGNNVQFQTVNPLTGVSYDPQGFGHEGRMPPRVNDYRYHPRYQGGNGTTTFGNIGQNSPGNTATIIRMNRVWDSWSTAYTNAPDSDIDLHGFVPGLNTNPPIYPSYPAPYPSPLRGIQIQIRVVDPRNERSKVLTIRHDFTDKLTN